MLAPQVKLQAALRQLLEFGLFHGDPHAGNIFAMDDGRPAAQIFVEIDWYVWQQHASLLHQDSVRWLWQCGEHLGKSTRCADPKSPLKPEREGFFAESISGARMMCDAGNWEMSGCTMQSLIHILKYQSIFREEPCVECLLWGAYWCHYARVQFRLQGQKLLCGDR